MSDVLTVSNGCPQGCVLSPVLFSIFTNEFTINEENFRVFKYAVDMALVGLLDKTNQTYDLAYLTHTNCAFTPPPARASKFAPAALPTTL